MNKPARVNTLNFYTTPPHACSYLDDRQAVTLFADPGIPKTADVYAFLSAHGFRRSGEHLYRPHCPHCQACVPVRLPVDDFVPRRHQQRALEINSDIDVRERPAGYDEEHFKLYRRYLEARHAGGGMDNPTPQQFKDFLTSRWAETVFFDMRLNSRLVGVAVVDRMRDALSAVYTYFDPKLANRSLGKFAVLCEIAQAKAEGKPWLYLGYWIRNCRKMRYKTDYQPLEYLWDGVWERSQPPTP